MMMNKASGKGNVKWKKADQFTLGGCHCERGPNPTKLPNDEAGSGVVSPDPIICINTVHDTAAASNEWSPYNVQTNPEALPHVNDGTRRY